MKSQVLTLLLLTTGAFLFRSTHQSRLFKRELTEYDLTNFIVNTCSAEKTEAIIQNLCDQTMQSALMGNFPFLLYYCKTIGAERRFCGDLNRQTDTIQSDGAKRFAYRRFVRSLNEDNRSNRGGQESGIESDLEQKMILQICLTNTEKRSSGTRRFCNQKLQEAQRGRYPEITRLCNSHPAFAYCRRVLSYSPSRSWPLSTSSSSFSTSLPLSTTPNSILSSVPPSSSSAIESVTDYRRINNNEQKQHHHHHHHDQQIDV